MQSLKQIKESAGIIRNLNQKFDLNDKSVLLLLGAHKTDDKYIEELQKNMPQGLINYRYLMHPIRLMIIKLLYSEFSLSSIEIKKVLKITWGEYTSHAKSMVKKGYLDIKEQFTVDASVKQVLFLSKQARVEYEAILELLGDLIEKKTPIDYIVNSDPVDYMDDRLYPTE
ncbi:MAG: hypothetical protein GPJ54_16720 [Candidatus Heimdallarchaeota archaeon]|nr:hypothetical protein [Candidatus Heimdallarchaeota archaeon]